MAIKRQSIAFPDLRFEDERLNRLMQATRAMATELQRLQQMLRSGSDGQVLEKNTAQDYDASWVDGAAGTITGGENLGPGVGLFEAVSGTKLTFKTLIEGANITITASGDTITISAAGGGAGSGTVTSVDIASSDLEVVGAPITSDGTITLTIAPNVVTYAKMQQTSADSVVIGRRIGEGPGELEELSGSDVLAIAGLSSGYPKQLAYAGIV